MIINRKCDIPVALDNFIDVQFDNEYKVTTDQIKGKSIRRNGVVIGTLTDADNDSIYGYIFSGKSIYGGDLTKAEFTYDVEVERK